MITMSRVDDPLEMRVSHRRTALPETEVKIVAPRPARRCRSASKANSARADTW